MEILDEEQLESTDAAQLHNPLFLKRLKIFSIVTLIHACALLLLFILFPLFFVVEDSFLFPESVLLVYSSLFALLGAILLFRTYHFIHKYIRKSKDLSDLGRGMHHFFIFWIVLIFGFLLMIGFLFSFGF